MWLNILFPPLPKWSGFRTVSFSLVGMAAVVGAVILFVPKENNSNQLAMVQDNSNNNTIPSTTNDTVSENSEFKVNPEQYAELKSVSGIYVTPVVREVEHVHEAPTMDEVHEENAIAPADHAIEIKADRSMEYDSPAVIESTNAIPTITSTSTSTGNLSSPAVQWTTDEKVNVIVTDSVKIQPKKKKKTPPKKK
ncbi:MAG: hypothetical protein ACEQSL_07075 [Sediminibacterium sp.]